MRSMAGAWRDSPRGKPPADTTLSPVIGTKRLAPVCFDKKPDCSVVRIVKLSYADWRAISNMLPRISVAATGRIVWRG